MRNAVEILQMGEPGYPVHPTPMTVPRGLHTCRFCSRTGVTAPSRKACIQSSLPMYPAGFSSPTLSRDKLPERNHTNVAKRGNQCAPTRRTGNTGRLGAVQLSCRLVLQRDNWKISTPVFSHLSHSSYIQLLGGFPSSKL